MAIKRLLHPARAPSRWLALFLVSRLAAAGVAAVLLLAHRITDHDGLLAGIALAYGFLTALAAARIGRRSWLPVAWAADAVLTLALVLAGGNWRSPFYLLALTSLILPATSFSLWRGVGFTLLFTAGYFGVAASTGVDWTTLETSARLESFATHLLLPLLMGVGLAYAAELLRRLETERARSERLVLEAERRRLARELHDSAKQRLLAAHLVLSAIDGIEDTAASEGIHLALRELEAATGEMEASLTDLRAATGDRSLLEALRLRGERLEALGTAKVEVSGADLRLPTHLETHVYHVVTEALINAVRHADARAVRASMKIVDGRLVATVVDDGRGLAPETAWDSHGVRSMVERAELLGGELQMDSVPGGAGTSVRLELPLDSPAEKRT